MNGCVPPGTDKFDYAARFHDQLFASIGAFDAGAPARRCETLHAGYIRDLDGNMLNAFCMTGG